LLLALFAPAATLVGWYCFHYFKTGYVFGNPEFFRYNVQATLSPLRILLALAMRIWQAFGYLHLFVLTLLTGWAMTKSPRVDNGTERPRIAIPSQCVFGVVVVAYIAAMAVIGGAVLARYMLPVVPLVVLICVSTLWRRTQRWKAMVGTVAVVFIAGLFMNPPYGFAPEDNLAYRDYIQMHAAAAQYLEAHRPPGGVLTAWPASDELTRPYLGYVTRPFTVIRAEDFSAEQILAAAQSESRYDAAFLFSTKYEPEHPFLKRWAWWGETKRRYFGYHEDLSPEVAAAILGGQVRVKEYRAGQWVAVISIENPEDALGPAVKSGSQQVAGMGFHDQPHFATRH
jgi:hypothetical protein